MPGGLRRDGDGWKLSTRVRIVHARIRALLAKSDDWRHEAWGVPVSAAHLGLAISVFSKRLLDYSSLLGADFEEEERASVLDVWRYAGYVMGIPESILYTDGASAQRDLHRRFRVRAAAGCRFGDNGECIDSGHPGSGGHNGSGRKGESSGSGIPPVSGPHREAARRQFRVSEEIHCGNLVPFPGEASFPEALEAGAYRQVGELHPASRKSRRMTRPD